MVDSSALVYTLDIQVVERNRDFPPSLLPSLANQYIFQIINGGLHWRKGKGRVLDGGEREKEGCSVEATAAAVRNRLSWLRLDSGSVKSSSAADPKYPVKTLKRRSPTQSPPLSQPNPKKEKLSHPPHPPPPLLRRCISDTFCFKPTPPPPPSRPEPTVTVTPPLPPPPPPTGNAPAAASASTINPKPKLRRSVSVPNPRSLKTVSGSNEDDITAVLGD